MQTGNNTPCEKLFTIEEVKEIVSRVVAEREAALRQEYNLTLEKLLRGTFFYPAVATTNQNFVDQFTMFSQFNQDNISRQLKQR